MPSLAFGSCKHRLALFGGAIRFVEAYHAILFCILTISWPAITPSCFICCLLWHPVWYFCHSLWFVDVVTSKQLGLQCSDCPDMHEAHGMLLSCENLLSICHNLTSTMTELLLLYWTGMAENCYPVKSRLFILHSFCRCCCCCYIFKTTNHVRPVQYLQVYPNNKSGEARVVSASFSTYTLVASCQVWFLVATSSSEHRLLVPSCLSMPTMPSLMNPDRFWSS